MPILGIQNLCFRQRIPSNFTIPRVKTYPNLAKQHVIVHQPTFYQYKLSEHDLPLLVRAGYLEWKSLASENVCELEIEKGSSSECFRKARREW